jgi:hemerythrin
MSTVAARLLEWTPEYSVHVPGIDREHRKFFGILNRLHRAMLEGKGKEILETLLAEVTNYAGYHFAHEKELMTAVRYPGLREHVREHDELRRTAQTFQERFERAEVTMTIELTLFLAEWLKRHILATDRRLGEFLGASRSAPPQ